MREAPRMDHRSRIAPRIVPRVTQRVTSTIALVLLVLAGSLLATAGAGAFAAPPPERYMLEGHVALDRSEYRKAANDFRKAAVAYREALAEIESEVENESYAEALYWQAFALHRLGHKRDLQNAAVALMEMKALEYEEERLHSEAMQLATRVKGDLALKGDAQAARELAEMIEEQNDQELKMAALHAMINMNPDRALPILEQMLRNREPGTAAMRRQAIFLIAQGEAEGAEELMIEVARNDPDFEVRQQAVFWLAQAGSEKSLEFLIDVILHSDDPEMQSQAIFALSHHDSERAAEVLQEVASDPAQPQENREAAIFWLGQSGGEEHLLFLRELYSKLEDPELKERVLFGVAQAGRPETAAWLLEIALDENEDLEARKGALFWAGQLGEVPVARMAELYRSLPDREMREQILFVMSQDDSDEALAVMMEIAREEEDFELRKNAVFWIGQHGGEEAEAFLIEIINR